MSLLDTKLNETIGDSICQNPLCGHPRNSHLFSTSTFNEPCGMCNCKNFNWLSQTLFTTDSHLTYSDPKQISKLEKELETSLREVEKLRHQLKKANKKDIKSQEIIGQLEIELKIVNDVKRNLKYLVDKK